MMPTVARGAIPGNKEVLQELRRSLVKKRVSFWVVGYDKRVPLDINVKCNSPPPKTSIIKFTRPSCSFKYFFGRL